MMKARTRVTGFLLIALLLPQAGVAQQAQTRATGPQTLAELKSGIQTLLDQPQFAAARIGARVIMASGTEVLARDEDKLFTPASNMKLYTTAATLDAFGPDHRFKTSVYTTRRDIRNGTLRGDLILYGRGDPNISARFENPDGPGVNGRTDDFVPADRISGIEALADQIKAHGIRRIVGDVIGDDSYFATDGRGWGWEWDDLQFYYGAPVSALTVNDNVVTFVVKPAPKAGMSPTITVRPQTTYVRIVNQATTAASGATRIGVNRPLSTNTVEFFGSIPARARDFEVNISIHDPAGFAATLLKEALARRGITVTGRVRTLNATARVTQPFQESAVTELASIQSQPLSVLLKVINKPSQNLHTEIMLRQLGVRFSQPVAPPASAVNGGTEPVMALDDYGRPKTSESFGIEAMKSFLQRAGIDPGSLSLRDGSGLARQDLVTPRATTQLLLFMATHPHFAVWRDSLPVAGVDGTLERRMRDTAAERNVRAKTGTLSYVHALSGYVYTKRGQMLIFSLMSNNYTNSGRDVTQLFDQICVLLAAYESDLPATR